MLWGPHNSFCKQMGIYQLDHRDFSGLFNLIIGFRFKQTISFKTVEWTFYYNPGALGQTFFLESNFNWKTETLNAKNVPFLTCASVFYVPFFHPDSFIAFSPNLFSSEPSHLSVLYRSTLSGQNRAHIFHISIQEFQHLITALHPCQEQPFQTLFYFRPWKYLILLLIRHSSCRWCLVLL